MLQGLANRAGDLEKNTRYQLLPMTSISVLPESNLILITTTETMGLF